MHCSCILDIPKRPSFFCNQHVTIVMVTPLPKGFEVTNTLIPYRPCTHTHPPSQCINWPSNQCALLPYIHPLPYTNLPTFLPIPPPSTLTNHICDEWLLRYTHQTSCLSSVDILYVRIISLLPENVTISLSKHSCNPFRILLIVLCSHLPPNLSWGRSSWLFPWDS